MTWNLVRLTLARTAEYPEGSDEHAFEIVVPLLQDGRIDRKAFATAPGRATVQRIWPGQGVQRGQILAKPGGFAFSYEPGDADDEDIYHLANHALIAGNYITLAEPDGEQLPFRVVAVRRLPAAVSL